MDNTLIKMTHKSPTAKSTAERYPYSKTGHSTPFRCPALSPPKCQQIPFKRNRLMRLNLTQSAYTLPTSNPPKIQQRTMNIANTDLSE